MKGGVYRILTIKGSEKYYWSMNGQKQEAIDNFPILFSYNREKEYFCYRKISIIYESIFQ